MRLYEQHRVDMATATARALEALDIDHPTTARAVANAVWPGHKMKAQGAALAAMPVLKRLQLDGLARRVKGRGWLRCSQ